MQLTVNEKSMQFSGETVAQLLDELNMRKPFVAVSVNEQIVPRSEHETSRLNDQDKIIIVHAVGGG